MSEHMRRHHTDSAVLYVMDAHKAYAIPRKVAEKYLVEEQSVSSHDVFSKLEQKLTKTGALLKGLRTREGLTQLEFSERIEVTQSNLSNMENGRRPIGKIIAKRIEKIFKVDYRYFLA